MNVRQTLHYPHPTNEVAARLVAGMVALLGVAILALDEPRLLPALVYGFAARVVAGPRFSPMGLLAVRVLVPVLGNPHRPTAGPPKRFAQGIGLAVSGAALVSWLLLGHAESGRALLVVLVAFALLEAVVGFCAGCVVFRYLMRWGWIPEETCERCQNLTLPTHDPA
jgi:hypothetical protein